MENRAYEVARQLWNEEPEPILDADQLRAIDAIVARARKEFLDG